ncbi:hypothetical protein J1N35_026004 [Gossypium stocksii]|uniref:Uncharacterized protein n=1 Tax=Gossypium stocksii TaxID=47602 RepID=A0A9D3V7D6_9ROSI|nr:hypothetical protein J1N35_026004 [Gossypium stocksii]
MEWKGKCSLIIEIESIEEVEIRLSRIENVSFSKADKHGSKIAFALVVAGLKRPECLRHDV